MDAHAKLICDLRGLHSLFFRFTPMPRSSFRSASPSHRLERVSESIRHALAEILSRGEVVNPVLNTHVVTIAYVRMSPDLKLATVATMPLGGKDAQETLAALEAHKKELRALVARRVNLKYAPDLRFVLDDSFDAQERIDALLRSQEVARDLSSDAVEEPK
jgi:ribosome-binding factor A